jgi:LmbE family N-acetylglucosaminyl deacetylase
MIVEMGDEPSRRRILAAGAVGLMMAGLAGGDLSPDSSDPGDIPDPNPMATPPSPIAMTVPAAAVRPALAERTAVMHVIAHPDDDLFFFNPEIAQAITAGHRVIGVCLTAAESSGLNGPTHFQNVHHYVKARQNGLRSAYGTMATGNPAALWSSGTLTMPGGAKAEVDTLGQLTLIFLNIRKGPLWGRLRDLWNGSATSVSTMVPTGSAVHHAYHYSHQGLIAALNHLLATYRPTLVRTMDPDPDFQLHNHKHPQHTDFDSLSDHEDHTATAQFTWAALAGYKGPGAGDHWMAESYRGYYNCRWPYNLSVRAWHAKRDLIRIYDGTYPVPCSDPAGCADLSTKGRVTKSGWVQSTHHRYESTSSWLVPSSTGALTAFAVLDGQLATWTETAPASGSYGEPVLLGGGPLVPALSVATGPNGRWAMFGQRAPVGRSLGRPIVFRSSDSAKWETLGTPEHGSRRRQVGVPVAVWPPTGPRVFVRTWAKGLSTRARRPDGSWTPWQNLHGGPIQEGASAVVLPDGRIEVYGTGRLSLIRWYQKRAGGPFLVDGNLNLPAPGTPPTAVTLADGTLLVVYRMAGNAETLAFRRPPGSSKWTQTHLGGQGGFGPMPVTQLPTGPLVIAQRNDNGAVSVATTTGASVPTWTGTGSWFAHSPAVAKDARGRLILARLGPDAKLYTTLVEPPRVS